MGGDVRPGGSLSGDVLINLPCPQMEWGESICACDAEKMVLFTSS